MRPFYSRLITPPRQTFFLLGPRGTGKSTWAKKWRPYERVIDLLDESNFQRFLASPEMFAALLKATPAKGWVLVDEIQRLPNLLNEIHRSIEERQLNFVMTGSSARKLKQVGTNLLGGRAFRRFLFPLTPEEMGDDFNIEHALQLGTLPVILGSSDPKEALQHYLRMYLKEEIQAEALVRNLAGFSRFLPIAGLFHGQILHTSNIARDAGVKRTTVQGFLEILEDTLLAFRVPAYEGRLRVREKKHPKFYWIDPGIARVARQETEVDAANIGCLFEGWLAQLLRSYQEYRGLFEDLYYWAPAEAKETEVDFLLKRGKEFIAIEAKATKRIRDSHFKGLNAVSDLKGLKRKILVYLGEDRLRVDSKIDVLPLPEFCELLSKKQL